ncbi:type II toxin-antitoxin system VapB family antitoxin [Ornithinimicrobium cryptoxanthini]|uniref:Type II toxin-antitoxin system VapB family antitoxin n=1 Tax=Ornithinimicrobium cryptoxanthini TaxID=2934161 RepID=A0ABY4YJZ7_9MICO|nr:type II toxin-antitoxin system VapB family antitoxin [Ornithinimicrobium cryptoxanthini]USQ76580.1 type II toxin-antitoxin system VapB family antitoxin [Ornithinimicrobium cryptoxanthini]
MRTTLEIDDQVMAAARSLARSRGTSVGAAVSELARRGLMQSAGARVDAHYSPFPVMVGDEGVLVTDELIAELRDD